MLVKGAPEVFWRWCLHCIYNYQNHIISFGYGNDTGEIIGYIFRPSFDMYPSVNLGCNENLIN